jgi:hypothetical protein
VGDDKEAIKGSLEITPAVGPEDGEEPLLAHTSVTRDKEAYQVGEDRENGLAAAVVQHELVGRSGSVPALADGAAAEEVLGWQSDKDLFDNDPLG